MFAKLSLFAAIVLPLVHALTIDAPTDAVSAQPGTINFSGDGNDPTFSIELNHPSLLNAIAVANNVNPGDGSVSVIWPRLLETTGYTLQAVNISNINDVFATSGAFNIAPPPSGSSSSVSLTATNPPSGSASATAPSSPRPSAPSGTTNSASAPTTGSQTSGSQTQSSGSTESSSSPTQINGNSAFSVQSNLGAVALAAIGAAVFAL